MKRKNLFLASMFVLLAAGLIGGLSSFKGDSKTNEKKPFSTVVRYFVNGAWVTNDPGTGCPGEGQYCRIQYDDSPGDASPSQIIAQVTANYTPSSSGEGSTISVVVDGVTYMVTIDEKTP